VKLRSKLPRLWWRATPTEDGADETREEVGPKRANLLGSRLGGNYPVGWHAPTLDIDLPCELIPSSTKGHFHLIIDKPMPWSDYVLLLSTLAKVGIIEDGYFNVSLARGETHIRKPGETKKTAPLRSGGY
jgi:hypothetical protein